MSSPVSGPVDYSGKKPSWKDNLREGIEKAISDNQTVRPIQPWTDDQGRKDFLDLRFDGGELYIHGSFVNQKGLDVLMNAAGALRALLPEE